MNNFAVSNTDILEGLKRSSAAMSAMGQDLDSTIALFTAAEEVLQDPASTGTALRSMSLRMRGFDEETEEVSEDLVNINGDIIDLTKTAEHAQGVSIFTDATQTQYKDFVDYFRELSEVWDEMSAKNQTKLLNNLFGKRGAQAGSALIKNFATVEAALEKMQNSAGNAEKEMSVITQSLSYKLNALKETGTGIAQNLFARKDIGMVVDGLTALLSVVDALTEKLGLFGTLGAAGGIFAFIKNLSNLQNMGKVATAFAQLSGSATSLNAVKAALAGMSAETIGATAAMVGYNAAQTAQIAIANGLTTSEAAKMMATAGFTAAETEAAMVGAGYSAQMTSAVVLNTEFAASATGATGATLGFAGALQQAASGMIAFLTTNPIGWAMMVVAATGIAMAAVANATKTFDDLKESADNSYSEYQATQGELDGLNAKIKENSATIDELRSKGTLTLVEEAQLNMLTATNEQLKKQAALKQKVANSQQSQAASDASMALNENTRMVTNNTGTKEKPVYTTESVDIIDETLNLQDKMIAKQEKIAELTEEQSKYDYGSKEYEKIGKQIEQAKRDENDLNKQISNNLSDIYDLREGLVDASTGEAIEGYAKDVERIDKLTYDLMTDSEKAAYKQSKINNLLSDTNYKKMANDMVEFAKAQGEAGITGKDIKENFSEMAQAAEDAGIDINDLAQTINAMTGSTNMKEVTKQLNEMKDSVKNKEVKKYLDDLFATASDEELKIYYRIMKTNDTSDWSIEDWQGAIEELQSQTIEIEFSIEGETAKIDTLRNALSESRGNTGVSNEMLTNIRETFGSLDGFDESKIFYNTANGVRANSAALKELQKQYVNLKKAELNDQLREQSENLAKANAELSKLKETDEGYAEAQAKVDLFSGQIAQTEQLISQYNALTSAYNEWVAAQSSANERDMYQNAGSGYEATGSLIEQGWINDDSVQAYIDLMTYGEQASFSAEEVKNRYEELGKTIEGTSYSVKDFFMTMDEEGNASVDETTGGIKNFVSALGELGQVGEENILDASKADEYAQALGVDVSLVETMIRAAEEAGYTVNNTWASSTATLQEVNSELETAQQQLDQFRNEDGSININAEGAEEAQQKVTDLLAKKQELEQSSGIMSIDVDTSGFDEGVSNAISKLQELQTALNEYEAAKMAGIDTSEAEANIQSLASEIEGLDPEIKAQVGLEEGSDLASQIQSLASGSQVEVGAKLEGGAGAAITAELNSLNAEAIVKFTAEHGEVDSYAGEEKQGTGVVTWSNSTGQVDSYAASTKTSHGTVIWGNDTSGVQTSFTATGTVNWVNASGPGKFMGNAFASGKWGTNQGGTALVGELAKEMIVDPKSGRWYTVGENGAEFVNIPAGAIIFNHVQTEQILKNGHINSRGHAYASGNAFASGTAFASGSDSDKVLDWVEVFIDRLERGIKKLEKAVDNVYKTWSNRSQNLTKEISKVKDQITAQQKAYQAYLGQANAVGLDASWQSKVKSGNASLIEHITDNDLNDKISKFKDFYEKALSAKDAVDELKEKMAELYTTAFENAQKNYDHQIKLIDHLTETYKNGVDLLEARGRLVGSTYYKAMESAERQHNSILQKELNSLITRYNQAMNSGYIEQGSQQWYEFNEEINKTKEELQESNIELAKLAQQIKELEWDNFDYLEDRIGTINDEAEFMISLLSHRELKDEDGLLTDAGLATMGLHGQRYNVYMAQADDYAEQIRKLNKELSSDPYNTNLIERREKMYELQRKMILAAEDEKDAIMDLVKDGYDAQLTSMKKVIDEYTDTLDRTKDLYDYQKKVRKQTETIAKIQKQLSAYGGDTSEENRARIQKLQVDLEEAQADLAETEYDKYVKDQRKMLNDMYSEYEENINQRMDEVDYSITEMIGTINNNALAINDTLHSAANEVGYTLTDEMSATWDKSMSDATSIITQYGDTFNSQLTTVNYVLSQIDARVASMIGQSEKEAKSTVNSTTKSTSVTKPKSTSKSKTSKKSGNTKTGNGIVTPIFTNGSDRLNVRNAPNASGTVIRQLAKGNLVETDWKESNGWLHIRVHNSKEDYWGWVSKQYVKAYARGVRRATDGFAWTQEYGSEAILSPTQNAMLTKLNSGDAVLSAKATDNIFSFGNNPQAFLAKLGLTGRLLDSASLLSGLSTASGRAGVDVGGISVNIPIEHVEDYNDLVNQIKSDKKFEKFIQSITVDRLVGGSALAKRNIKW